MQVTYIVQEIVSSPIFFIGKFKNTVEAPLLHNAYKCQFKHINIKRSTNL